jgi:isopentenyl diphosphate isomerase/L-lactate dehydrogenase-like FMN-dependent dehydrogenase
MQPINLREYERLAESRLDAEVWSYYAGGAEDEVTLRANESDFDRFRLRPRVLADVTSIELSTTVMGEPVSMPVLVAPMAGQGMAHAEGECATARAAAAAGTIMAASSSATCSLRQIAESCPGARWFQLYVRYWDEAERLVKEAESVGYSALVLTADLPRMGNRERDVRSGFKLSRGFHVPNYLDRQEGFQLPSLTWKSLERIRAWSSLPLVLKGIHTGEDAAIAVEHGVDAMVVSNHGGRQLDGAVSAIEALPEAVEAVRGRCEVYMDGGIRRGTHVLKALALGARAVFVGRPILWGLAVDGESGVRHVLEILKCELERAMALAGCPDLSSVSNSHIMRAVDGSQV